MTTRPDRAGRPGRAAPRRWAFRVGLVAVSFAALLSQGCSSLGNGCSTGCGSGGKCGLSGLGARLTSFNLGQRLFHHKGGVVATDSCDGSLGAVQVESGGVGAFPPGSVLQSPPPSGDPNIEAIPSNGGSLNPPSGGANGAQGANSRPTKSLYQTRIDGTRGEAQQARREVPTSHDRDPLADIPKLSAPNEAAPAAEASPPVAPTAGDRPAAETKPTPTGKPAETSAGLGPGIRRFKVIEPRLAIGNLPSETGWKWLSELGYRTVIDLRQPSEVQPGDLAAINHQGLRYLAIPMSATAIDPATITRLEKEFERADARPIFVFDGDGMRPASVGFLHLVNVRKADSRTAEREVEEMGAADSRLWKATLVYLANPPAATTPAHADALPKEKDSASPSSSLPRAVSLWDSVKPSIWDGYGARLTTTLRPAMDIAAPSQANPPDAPTEQASADPASGG
jgi:protein tyrosine phosphatase (PTP) superfamily phosphohydrolase (DUF442 family)